MERIRLSASLGGILLSGLVGASPSVTPASAQPLSCGTIHTVESGDTLDGIAARAYGGKGFLSGEIFKANADFLRDARRLEIGDRLLVPCLDGSGPQSRAAALEGAQPLTLEEMIEAPTGSIGPAVPATFRAAAPKVLRMVASAGLVPFADPGAEAGGLVTDLLSRAVAATEDGPHVTVDFVEGTDALARALSDGGVHVVSFPWLGPDCGQPATPDAAGPLPCESLIFSRGLVEVTIGYYTSRGNRLLRTDGTTLAGQRICRSMAGGTARPDLAERSEVYWQDAATPADCLDRLRAGETDVVMMPVDQAAEWIAVSGNGEVMVEIAALRETRTLHAAARKGDADGEAALARINLGIERIMLSGSWFEVVAAHRSRLFAVQ